MLPPHTHPEGKKGGMEREREGGKEGERRNEDTIDNKSHSSLDAVS